LISLVHISGARTGGVDQVDTERFELGRGPDCEVRFHAEQDRAVGKVHAEVEFKQGRYLLRDRDSRNGTYVNGRLVREVYLRQGDVIRLGAEGPQLRVDLTGADVSSVIRAMRRKHWRPIWIPVVLLLLVALGFAAIWARRQVSHRLDGVEQEIATLDEEINALLAVMEETPGSLDELAARHDRMVDLEGQAAGKPGRRGSDRGDDATLDRQMDTVLEAFGEPAYAVPGSFRSAVRKRVGAWLEADALGEIYCTSEIHLPAIQPVLARYSLPDVLAFLPWILGQGSSGGDLLGPWGIGAEEAEALGLLDDEGHDLRLDPLASTEAIATRLQRDVEALSTSSILLATLARDPAISATVESLREQDAWTRPRRNVRFLWLAGLLDDDARQRIPSLVAAAVVGRNPDQYGLTPDNCASTTEDSPDAGDVPTEVIP
jgi:hypothetical protein